MTYSEEIEKQINKYVKVQDGEKAFCLVEPQVVMDSCMNCVQNVLWLADRKYDLHNPQSTRQFNRCANNGQCGRQLFALWRPGQVVTFRKLPMELDQSYWKPAPNIAEQVAELDRLADPPYLLSFPDDLRTVARSLFEIEFRFSGAGRTGGAETICFQQLRRSGNVIHERQIDLFWQDPA